MNEQTEVNDESRAEGQSRLNDGLGWMPIETAPKDGTQIELLNENSGLTDMGFWCDYTKRGYQSLSGLDGEWDQEFGNGDMTHWRVVSNV